MPVETEVGHTGEFLISEAAGNRSRENITIDESQTLVVGQVLGRIKTGAVGAAAAVAGNTGNGTVGTVTDEVGVQSGTYRVLFIAATKFEVYDPSGEAVGKGTTGAAFSNQIGFTITAGGTAFVAGDEFTIAVAVGTLRYVALDLAADDGSSVPAAILWDAVETGAAETAAAVGIVRDAEVNGNLIAYPAGASSDDKAAIRAKLAELGVIVRL